eukprot:g3608.t1
MSKLLYNDTLGLIQMQSSQVLPKIFQAELRSILHSYINATGQGITYSCITYEKCRVLNPINYSDGNDYSLYLSECTGDCVVIWKISYVSRLERMVLARVLYNLKRLWLLVYMFWVHLATCTVEAQRWGGLINP